MTKEIFNELAKILKAERGRKSPNNFFEIITEACVIEGDYPQLDELRQRCYELDLDDWNVFKPAYDAEYGKRKKAGNVAMTEVYVGDLLEETEKAYKFDSGKMLGFNRPNGYWVPKSQVTYNEQESTLLMPVWLAREKNYMSGK